jgi:hypothetical protein
VAPVAQQESARAAETGDAPEPHKAAATDQKTIESGPVAFCLKVEVTSLSGEFCRASTDLCESVRTKISKETEWTVGDCQPVYQLWCSEGDKRVCNSTERECESGEFNGSHGGECKKVQETKAPPLVLSAKQQQVVEDWVALWKRIGELAQKHKDNCDAAAAAFWKEFDQNRAAFKALHELNVEVGEKKLRATFIERIQESMDWYFNVAGGKCAKNDAMDRVRLEGTKLYKGE